MAERIPKNLQFYPSGLVNRPLEKSDIEFWGHDAGEFGPAQNPLDQGQNQVETDTQSPTTNQD